MHVCIMRVPDQNGISLLYIMLEIHHSGREPSIMHMICVIIPIQTRISIGACQIVWQKETKPEREREKERDRQRERERQTETETDRDRDR